MIKAAAIGTLAIIVAFGILCALVVVASGKK